MVDWTKQPIGAARGLLSAQVNNARRLLDRSASAREIDDQLKNLEKAIQAFRDNER